MLKSELHPEGGNILSRYKYKIIFFLFLIVIFGMILAYFNNDKNPRVLGTQISNQQPIVIIDNGVEFKFRSAEDNLADIFKDIGIEVFPEDKISVLVDPVLGLGSRIKIQRATVLTVNDGGALKTYRTWAETVNQLLEEKEIELYDVDRISPSLNTPIGPDMKIIITRVQTDQRKEKVSIPYETVYKDDPSLFIGKTQVSQNGKNGEKEVLFKLTYENNQLVDKEPISEEVLTKPQNKIILKGTKPYSTQEGMASWLNGATASRKYSRGTKLRVINLANGKSTITTVGGWGPQIWTNCIIDLSHDAFNAIADPFLDGKIRVRVEEI